MKTSQREKNIVTAVLAVAGVVWLLSLAPAGDLEPPSAPGPTMHTLDEVYNLHAPAPGFHHTRGPGPGKALHSSGRLGAKPGLLP